MNRFLSLDIETGGLHPAFSLLEIGLVAFDLEDAELQCVRVVVVPEVISISPDVLSMHALLLEEIERVRKETWWKELLSEGFRFGGVVPGAPESRSNYLTLYCSDATGAIAAAFRNALERIGFRDWRKERITVAGKNVASFDIPFLDAHDVLSNEEDDPVEFRHRVMDPGMTYMHADDSAPPNLATCLERAGLVPTDSHTAIGDALDVVALLRKAVT